MKYLGIDYGEKRVGVAVSDAEGKVAFPKVVLENNAKLIEKIKEICQELSIEAIIIGESKNYKGEDNKINPKILAFKKSLSSINTILPFVQKAKSSPVLMPIFLEPEFMTSMDVEKTFGKTDMLDASAASIILQTFLDKAKNRKDNQQKEILPLAQKAKSLSGKISIDDFLKIEMRVGKILSAEPVAGSDKLLKLSVDFKEGTPRQILSGIAKYFSDPQTLIGKKVAFVTNLEPRKMMGLESNGMILAVHSTDQFALMELPDNIEPGTKLG